MDEPANAERSIPGPSRLSAAQFLIALVVLLVVSPALDDIARGDLIEALLLTLVLVTAIPAVGGTRRTMLIGCLLAFPAVAGKWLHHLHPDLIPAAPFLIAAIVFAAFIVVHHLRFVLWAPEVDTQVLCAAVSTFLMLGLLWMFAYLFLESVAPGAMSVQSDAGSARQLTGFDALYFSLATLSGVSYGEITPDSDTARMLALLEAMTSLFYIAILISRLVALHTERAASRR